jgi:hypothetical protein
VLQVTVSYFKLWWLGFEPMSGHVGFVVANVRFGVFTAVTMKNVFWNIKLSSYLTGDTLCLRYRAQQINSM